MVVASLLSRHRLSPDVGRVMVQLHVPEELAAELRHAARSAQLGDRSSQPGDRQATASPRPATTDA